MSELQSATEIRAYGLRNGLDRLFLNERFDTGLISSSGALCLDVAQGPEIIALSQFDPKPFFVSEGRRYPQEISTNLSVKSAPFFIGHEALDALDFVSKYFPETRFGLITWINAYPSSLTAENLMKFIKEVSGLVIEGGMVIVSDLFEASIITTPVTKCGHLQFKIDNNKYAGIGRRIMIGRSI